jgi:transmembrane sensor
MKPAHPTDPRDTAALAWARREGVAGEVFEGVHRIVRQRRRRRTHQAHGGLGALALVALIARSPRIAVPARTELPVTTTVLALPSKQSFPDGSTVELKEGAAIRTEFGAAERRVVLTQGEAHFDVEKDAARPFVVVAHGIEIRAVGTAFSVQLNPRGVEVLVSEGRVAVEHPVASAPAAPVQEASKRALATLEAGNRVTVDTTESAPSASPVVAMSEQELAGLLSWRVPRLRFAGTPLEEAIPIFNRHSRVQLVLGDREIATVKVSGILRADNTESLVQLLETEFGARATPRGEREIVLHAGTR